MNNLDGQYQSLLQYILNYGTKKTDRTGTGTISVFGRQIRHSMKEGFPLITSKKMAFKTMVTELIWFLRSDTNIKFLVDNNCHIWDGDAFKFYISKTNEYKGDWPDTMEEFINKIKTDDEFAKKWGELGKIYGFQWRKWGENTTIQTKGIDQISNLINDLKTNPDSRRLIVSAWNPSDLPHQVLPPCHYGFQVYTRELSWKERWEHYLHTTNSEKCLSEVELDKINYPTRAISLMWNQRSCDVPLGIPANILSYGLLLMMLAKQVNMVPDELIGNLGDCHIYLNQVEGVKEQLTREPYPLPTLRLSDREVNDISEYTLEDIILENYQSHPKIYFPLSN